METLRQTRRNGHKETEKEEDKNFMETQRHTRKKDNKNKRRKKVHEDTKTCMYIQYKEKWTYRH